ncbi:5578_t:CDS:2, partial [Paraglomus occultum]
QDNPPETLQTLLTYEKTPGQAQRFLGTLAWIGFNLLFFYNALDSGKFSEHKNKWVTVHKQRVIEYGQKYDDKLDYILETMPGAVQIPVDQKRLPCNPPAKMVIVQRTENGNDYKV